MTESSQLAIENVALGQAVKYIDFHRAFDTSDTCRYLL